jgi:hypothetical protein
LFEHPAAVGLHLGQIPYERLAVRHLSRGELAGERPQFGHRRASLLNHEGRAIGDLFDDFTGLEMEIA